MDNFMIVKGILAFSLLFYLINRKLFFRIPEEYIEASERTKDKNSK
jgi:hypothetical protein